MFQCFVKESINIDAASNATCCVNGNIDFDGLELTRRKYIETSGVGITGVDYTKCNQIAIQYNKPQMSMKLLVCREANTSSRCSLSV